MKPSHLGKGNVEKKEKRRKKKEKTLTRSNKPIRHNLHDPRLRFKPINLRSNLWLASKMLPVRIPRIRKPQIARQGMLHDIINGAEIFAQVRIQQHSSRVGGRVDESQLGGVREISLVAEDEGLVGGAGERGSWWVVDGAAVGVGEVGVAAGGDFVGRGVDDGDVDGVGDVSGPVACGVDFFGCCDEEEEEEEEESGTCDVTTTKVKRRC